MRSAHPTVYFSRRGFGGTSLFLKKRGSPKFFASSSLQLRQAVGQGFGVGEEGLDRGVAEAGALGDAFGLVPGDEVARGCGSRY